MSANLTRTGACRACERAARRGGARARVPDGYPGLAGARGGLTGVTAEQKEQAAKTLVGLYKNQLKEDPPDSLLELAGADAKAITEERDAEINEDTLRDLCHGDIYCNRLQTQPPGNRREEQV